MKKTLFIESWENHQKLVDILWEHRNPDGISVISESELLTTMNRSAAWLKKAICRLNTEDVCIQCIGKGRYIVHYNNLAERGVFAIIIRMMLMTYYDLEIVHWKNEKIMQEFGCSLKTVQMYRAYCTSGWIEGTKDVPNTEK